MNQKSAYRWMFAPAGVFLAVLTIIPVSLLIFLSLRSWSLVIPGSNEFAALGNYFRMIGDARFWNAIKVSVYYITVNTSLQLFIGFCLALVFYLDLKGTRFLRILFLLPMLIPPVVVGLTWRILFTPFLGGVNYYLSLLGITGPAWLDSPGPALAAVTIASIWEWTPLVMLVVLAGLESLPQEPFEAARIDGASFRQTVGHIIIPLLRPVLLIVLLLRIIDSLAILPVVFVMTGGGPVSATEPINLYAYDVGINYLHISYASSLLTIFMLLLLAFSLFFVKHLLKDTQA